MLPTDLQGMSAERNFIPKSQRESRGIGEAHRRRRRRRSFRPFPSTTTNPQPYTDGSHNSHRPRRAPCVSPLPHRGPFPQRFPPSRGADPPRGQNGGWGSPRPLSVANIPPLDRSESHRWPSVGPRGDRFTEKAPPAHPLNLPPPPKSPRAPLVSAQALKAEGTPGSRSGPVASWGPGAK